MPRSHARPRKGSRPVVREPSGGIPLERARLWELAIATALLWLLCFPALIGILQGLGLWHGERRLPAAGAALLAAGLVFGLSHRRPWNRTLPPERRPRFVRFATWLIGLVLYPNLLMGTVLLFRSGPPPDYATTAAIGLILSTVQGIFSWLEHRKERQSAAARGTDNRD